MDAASAENAGGDEAPEVEEPAIALQHLVIVEDQVNSDYWIGRLPLNIGEGLFCEVIVIAEGEQGYLVAVPTEVWNRRISARLLPQKALVKAVLCSVVGCSLDNREEVASQNVKLWVGYLAADHVPLVEFDAFQERPDSEYPFVSEPLDGAIPHPLGLRDLLAEKFTFFSAGEDPQAVGDPQAVAEPSRPDRIGALEVGLREIQDAMSKLIIQQQEGPPDVSGGRQVSFAAATPPGKGRRERGAQREVGEAVNKPVQLGGLDPAVVQSALAAGVSEDHLREMAEIMRRNPKRMEDVPARGRRREIGDLSESEDEEAEVECAVGASGSGGISPSDGGVAKAIVKLTKVCSALAESHSSKKQNKLDQLLDSSVPASSDGSGLGGQRRNAAALRFLRESLVRDPEVIYKPIEANLAADFQSRPLGPGTPLSGATARGWLESRSKVQNFAAHVRWVWAAAGIWDALMRGDIGQARARSALLVAAADQASIDSGSWLMSTVMLLEPPAPTQSFASHHPPGPQELQHTALVDSRWMDLFLSHVRELDNYQEAKKRLNRTKKDDAEKPAPKERAKAKAKATNKGKGSGKEQTAPEPDA